MCVHEFFTETLGFESEKPSKMVWCGYFFFMENDRFEYLTVVIRTYTYVSVCGYVKDKSLANILFLSGNDNTLTCCLCNVDSRVILVSITPLCQRISFKYYKEIQPRPLTLPPIIAVTYHLLSPIITY